MKQELWFHIAEFQSILDRLEIDIEPSRCEVRFDDGHSNLLAVVGFDDGRALVIKHARRTEMAARFATSRAAARMIGEATDLQVPQYLETGEDSEFLPLLAYWRIPGQPLAAVWGNLSPTGRARALLDWGRTMHRLHTTRLGGHGPLLDSRKLASSLADLLETDLRQRLQPAALAGWPEAGDLIDRLADDTASHLQSAEAPAVLVHNGLNQANVLYRQLDGDVRCIGVIDFEDAFGGPVEADLARTEVLHGPLFDRWLAGDWFDRFLSGYGHDHDSRLRALLRVYHLLNMGYHAAVSGLAGHASDVARAARLELDAWRTGHSHQRVLE